MLRLPPPTRSQLYTTEEVAREFQVCPATVDNWRRRRAIPFYKIGGGAIRFDLEAVRKHLRDHSLFQPKPSSNKPARTDEDLLEEIAEESLPQLKLVLGLANRVPSITNKTGLAKILGTTTRTVDRYRAEGKIPWFRVGGIKFNVPEVLAALGKSVN